MKNRFMATAICLLLVLAVIPLAACSQGGGGLFKPVYAAPISVANPETPSVVNPSITSPYDGTYRGTFNYEYREDRLEKVPGGPPYPVVVQGKEWTPTTFSLTVILKTVETGYESVAGITVDVTSVTCSDQNFGTGLSGVTPVPEKTGGGLPAYPPTTTTNPSQPGQGIFIYFPNGAYLNTVTFKTGDLQVSPGGQTLSGSTFSAKIPQEEGPLSKETLKYEDGSPSNSPRYNVNFKSWSLTRIAYSGIITTTEPPVTPPTNLTEGAKLTDIYGDVLVRKGGAGEWTKYDQSNLKPGDEVRTGKDGKVTLVLPDMGRIDLWAAQLVFLDTVEHIPPIQGWIEMVSVLSLGEFRVLYDERKSELERKLGIKTPSAVVVVHGTEFTVSVDKDGTTTTMVLEGFVEVQDLASNNTILLAPRQMITIPNVPGGLTEQDMLGRVTTVWPETIDRWWEKDLAATGEQPAPALSGVRLVIIVVVVAVVIVMVLIFALLLRRRHGRSPG